MYMIVGLGNPGQQYAATRHNVGFMMLDYLAAEKKLTFLESKWKALTAKGNIWDESVILLKPETFMNLSGSSVAQAAHYYKLHPENIMVLHDDLDIELGRLKIVAGGGDGGHKGIRSIAEHLGSKDFPRLKIGIGRPVGSILPEKYVLGKFAADEKEIIDKKMVAVAEGLKIFLQQGISSAMSVINQRP
jgi:PTH1 family peptidyl-tRNA hydrolase